MDVPDSNRAPASRLGRNKPPVDISDDTYDLAPPTVSPTPDTPSRPHPRRAPATGGIAPALVETPAKPPTVLPYQGGEDVAPDDLDPQYPVPIRDFWTPIALIVVAFGLGVVVGLNEWSLRSTLVGITAYVLMKTVVMLIGVPLMVRFARISFGRTESAILKLAAVALLPDAVGWTCLAFIPSCFAPISAMFAVGIVTWTLFNLLFELDWAETNWCAIVLLVCTVVPSALWWKIYAAMVTLAV